MIEKTAAVIDARGLCDAREVWIETGYPDLVLGESVAVNGACLTVTELSPNGRALFFVSHETLARTNLSSLETGAIVNLERALTLSTRLSGHLVQGHVDAVGTLFSAEPAPSTPPSWSVAFRVPASISRLLIEKGSIAINGVSLTINSVVDQGDRSAIIKIVLIPRTWAHTNLSRLKPGDAVNLEADFLAKHVQRLMETRL